MLWRERWAEGVRGWQLAVNADLNTVQEAIETNVYGLWRTAQAFIPLLRKSQHGPIVNVSSEDVFIL